MMSMSKNMEQCFVIFFQKNMRNCFDEIFTVEFYINIMERTTRETDWVHILDKFWMNKEKFTRAGFEPATSGFTCRRSELTSPIWRAPYFVNIFVRGAPVRSHEEKSYPFMVHPLTACSQVVS